MDDWHAEVGSPNDGHGGLLVGYKALLQALLVIISPENGYLIPL